MEQIVHEIEQIVHRANIKNGRLFDFIFELSLVVELVETPGLNHINTSINVFVCFLIFLGLISFFNRYDDVIFKKQLC